MRDDRGESDPVSKGSLKKITQNFFWAVGYNTAMVPLVSLGLLQPALSWGSMALALSVRVPSPCLKE